MYTYPQALDAMEKIATDLIKAAGRTDVHVDVKPDSQTGTASVTWTDFGYSLAATIYMPVLPARRKMTQAEFADYAGYIFHEVGHPLFTDKKVWGTAVAEGRSKLLNALEDVRIEKKLIDAKIAANGKAVLTDLVRSLDYKVCNENFDANDPRNIGFVLAFLGRHANGYDMDASLIIKQLDPAGQMAATLAWALPALGQCQSTKACDDLAKKILGRMTQQPKGEQGKKGKGEQGKGEGEGSKGEQGEGEQGEGKGEQSKGEGAKGESQGEAGKGSPSNSAGGDGMFKGEPQEPSKPMTDADVNAVDLTPITGDELSGNEAGQQASLTNLVRQAQAQADKKPSKMAVRHLDYAAHPTIAADAAAATRLRSLLASAMKQQELDVYEGGLRHGRLDGRAFAKMAAGRGDVFGRREMSEGYETDCVVLVDGSSSMMGHKARAAATMALVVAQAAAQVGVQCHVYLFTDGGLREVHAGRTKPSAEVFGSMPSYVTGGTPLCTSMLAVAMKQQARAKAKRRLLFVISDGICDLGQKQLKQTALFIEEGMGTEVANLSINMALQGTFRTEAFVSASDDIAKAGLGLMVKKLTQGAM